MVSLNVLVKRENSDLMGIDVVIVPKLQKAIMHIFSREQKAYAKSAKIKLSSGKSMSAEAVDEAAAVEENADEESNQSNDLEALSKEDEDGEDSAAEEDDSEAVIEEGKTRERIERGIWLVNYGLAVQNIETEIRLCEVTGKIVIGVLIGSMDQKWAKRLLQNSKALGAGYDRVVNELRTVVVATETQKK
jgi:hypothetical protein